VGIAHLVQSDDAGQKSTDSQSGSARRRPSKKPKFSSLNFCLPATFLAARTPMKLVTFEQGAQTRTARSTAAGRSRSARCVRALPARRRGEPIFYRWRIALVHPIAGVVPGRRHSLEAAHKAVDYVAHLGADATVHVAKRCCIHLARSS